MCLGSIGERIDPLIVCVRYRCQLNNLQPCSIKAWCPVAWLCWALAANALERLICESLGSAACPRSVDGTA